MILMSYLIFLREEKHCKMKRFLSLREITVKYRAHLVVKGFGQKKGIDFDEIFSPVVKMNSIRVTLSLVASMGLELEQLDVKTVFFHDDLEEQIYMVLGVFAVRFGSIFDTLCTELIGSVFFF